MFVAQGPSKPRTTSQSASESFFNVAIFSSIDFYIDIRLEESLDKLMELSIIHFGIGQKLCECVCVINSTQSCSIIYIQSAIS